MSMTDKHILFGLVRGRRTPGLASDALPPAEAARLCHAMARGFDSPATPESGA